MKRTLGCVALWLAMAGLLVSGYLVLRDGQILLAFWGFGCVALACVIPGPSPRRVTP